MNSNSGWRRKKKYREAVIIAFTPYASHFYELIQCAMDKHHYCTPKTIQPSHILSCGAYPELREEPMNILPMCDECHRKYENLGKEDKAAEIEKILPGRMELLRQIRLTPVPTRIT